MCGFFYDFKRPHIFIKRNHTIALRVSNGISENDGSIRILTICQEIRHLVTVKDIVTKDQARRIIADKISPNHKSLRKAIRYTLDCILKITTKRLAVFQ